MRNIWDQEEVEQYQAELTEEWFDLQDEINESMFGYLEEEENSYE